MMPQEQLVGRQAELGQLGRAYLAADSQLALVYGRRRIGKSFLLSHFVAPYPNIYYQATQQAESEELKSFTNAVRAALAEAQLPPDYSFASWEAALEYLTENYRRPKRLVVVLDEFPYLSDSTPGLASIIQRWWDRKGKKARDLMLVLCGSAQTFMESLDGAAAPLHQRFTVKVRLGPLDYRAAAAFTPNLTPADRARVFGILGGTPLYLRQWNQERSLRDNLLALFGDPGSGLVDSAELVLTADLPDARASYRVLQAVALGATKHSEIKDKAKVTSERSITRLIELQLLRKMVPATDHPDRTRRSVYRIADPYFDFYFRFIATNRSAIDRGLGEQLIDGTILAHLDDHMGHIFEDMGRYFATELIKRGELTADAVGSWWSTDGQHEIDVVGTSRLVPTFIGSVKWRDRPLDRAVARDLERDARALGIGEEAPRLLIGRQGAGDLTGLAHYRSISIDDMYI
jgi:AAA+ ATPase superfamily predicted ATPase